MVIGIIEGVHASCVRIENISPLSSHKLGTVHFFTSVSSSRLHKDRLHCQVYTRIKNVLLHLYDT